MKTWRILTKRQAEEDTNEIYSYIAKDNPKAAEGFLDAIETASSILTFNPEIGSPRYFHHTELHGLRFYPLKGMKTTSCFTAAWNKTKYLKSCASSMAQGICPGSLVKNKTNSCRSPPLLSHIPPQA
jgi:plasmid stabilization system protein ParE